MPNGIEVIFGTGVVSVMEGGFYKRELSSSCVDMLLKGGDLITEHALLEFSVNSERVMSNSES